MESSIKKTISPNVIERLKNGEIVIIYDGDDREGEADMVFGAGFATPERIELLRKDAGGLICAAIKNEHAKIISLPFFTDLLDKADITLRKMICSKTAYGDKPAFSIPINHCSVYTGITDMDRALTLRKLDEVLCTRLGDFVGEFYSPGHIFLLVSRGIENRRGHTELAVELGKMANLNGAMVLCEMLGSKNALTKNEAKGYARKHNMAFVEGDELVNSIVDKVRK